MRLKYFATAFLCLMPYSAAWATAQGVALHGKPKYGLDFKHFDYVNPHAPKGGSIRIGTVGDFDTLNPFYVKGVDPLMLSQLVFETLGEGSLDEPFSMYPALLKSFTISDDKMNMDAELHPQARFSDGKPVTTQDIEFSFQLFRSGQVPPFYRSYWQDIKAIKVKDQRTFSFSFAKFNPELPMIALQIPILPKHIYGQGDFGKDFTDRAVGSGPYVVSDFKRGSFITYKRNPDYWGKILPIRQGENNFDEITIKYYKDPTAELEAFKKGSFDFMSVSSSQDWATKLNGEKFEQLKWIEKKLLPHSNNQGSQGFFFNLRRPLFADIRVRKAIALAFDFEWSNKTLFYDQYTQNSSFFENSPLRARGPISTAERKVLEPFAEELPKEIFSQDIGYLGKGLAIRERLREAHLMLKAAGYKVENGILTGPHGPLKFNFLLVQDGFKRIIEPFAQNLKKLGIQVQLELREPSLYSKRLDTFDFDMIVLTIGQSQSPGNEQRDLWSSKAADEKYSRNYYGLKNPVVDMLIEKIIYAESREELVLYTQCLDRVLYHLHFAIHNWHIPAHRVAYWRKFGFPNKLPDYYLPRTLFQLMWLDKSLEGTLETARKSGTALP